ncbi:thiamine phosphate synthase [Flammeovirgaceae bacterium SG7u.111]|nr:thiamine phosphate synthase [Flammeovirgaceae bacterium SG7u.132]WPO34801.1 thiamine phosphate synthase [Flammeovirgaceae bacterium SG7u.111]
MMKGIYLVVNEALCLGKPIEKVVAEALEGGGLAAVQLWEPTFDTKDLVEAALKLKVVLEGSGIPFLIYDRVDVALAVGADGVHLGIESMPYAYARKILGKDAIIGLSNLSWENLEFAQNSDADYLSVGPIFPTDSIETSREPWGLEELRKIVAYTNKPIFPIGGMNETTIEDVAGTGANGVALVSAVCSSENPSIAVAQLNKLFYGVSKQELIK